MPAVYAHAEKKVLNALEHIEDTLRLLERAPQHAGLHESLSDYAADIAERWDQQRFGGLVGLGVLTQREADAALTDYHAMMSGR